MPYCLYFSIPTQRIYNPGSSFWVNAFISQELMLRGFCDSTTNLVEKVLGRKLLVVLSVLAITLPCYADLLHLVRAAVIRYR